MISLASKERPTYLYFFPIFFILNHFFTIVTPRDVANMNHVSYWLFNFIASVLVCCGLSWGVYWLFCFRFGKIKSGLLATLLILPLFLFQDALLFIEQWLYAGLRARLMLPVTAVLLLAVAYKIVKTKRTLLSITQYLNLVSLSLAIYTSLAVCFRFKNDPPKAFNELASTYDLKCNPCPDVFLFILDSYTSNKSLREYFNYDNSPFVDRLTDYCFAVTDESFSQYIHTKYSISATMNFDQIKGVDQYTSLANSINPCSVAGSFTKAGYDFRNYSLFDIDTLPAFYRVAPSLRVGFLNGIIEASALNVIFFDLWLKLNIYDTHLRILESVARESSEQHSSPKFIYAHLLAPHPPFTMDARGQRIDILRQPRNLANETAYINQISGLNKLILDSIDNIIKNSPTAIIIVMGDHGYRYLKGSGQDVESHTVFLAYRGPEKEKIHHLPNSNQLFRFIGDVLQKNNPRP